MKFLLIMRCSRLQCKWSRMEIGCSAQSWQIGDRQDHAEREPVFGTLRFPDLPAWRTASEVITGIRHRFHLRLQFHPRRTLQYSSLRERGYVKQNQTWWSSSIYKRGLSSCKFIRSQLYHLTCSVIACP